MQITIEERMAIENFLYKEARLADESRYSEWEALVDDDMHYWIPLTSDQKEGGLAVSILNDNRGWRATIGGSTIGACPVSSRGSRGGGAG